MSSQQAERCWSECLAAAEKVLGWESANADAAALKAESIRQLAAAKAERESKQAEADGCRCALLALLPGVDCLSTDFMDLHGLRRRQIPHIFAYNSIFHVRNENPRGFTGFRFKRGKSGQTRCLKYVKLAV